MTPGTEPTRTQTVRTRLADLWSHRRRIAAALLATAVLWGGFAAYQRHLAVTRVAFVNFPGFQLARIERARQSAAVRVESLDMASLDRVADYPVAYVFGRGLQSSWNSRPVRSSPSCPGGIPTRPSRPPSGPTVWSQRAATRSPISGRVQAMPTVAEAAAQVLETVCHRKECL